jgi:hypothetical protein
VNYQYENVCFAFFSANVRIVVEKSEWMRIDVRKAVFRPKRRKRPPIWILSIVFIVNERFQSKILEMFEQNNNGRNNSNHRKVFTSSFIDVVTVEHFVYFDSTRLSDFGSQHFISNYYTEATLLEFLFDPESRQNIGIIFTSLSNARFASNVHRESVLQNKSEL